MIARAHVALAPALARGRHHWHLARGPYRWSPRRPETAERISVAGLGDPLLMCRYDLAQQPVSGQHPAIDPPPGWVARPDLPLEEALPYPWEDRYAARQPFQPVRLWRNAIALRRAADTCGEGPGKAALVAIAGQLVGRMRDFTVRDGDAAFIENRFSDPLDPVIPPAPWVSAIANAFAILACRQLEGIVDTRADAQAYARAFLTIHRKGSPPPDRWISYRDRRGYLWFDEYPRPGGGTTRVMNGHIFAILALHEMSLRDHGFDPLVQAGATTIAAYAPCFRRPGFRNRYALDLWRKGDYLPNRAMRQLYQLYELTGEEAFLVQGDLFARDFLHHLPEAARKGVADARAAALASRNPPDPAAGSHSRRPG